MLHSLCSWLKGVLGLNEREGRRGLWVFMELSLFHFGSPSFVLCLRMLPPLPHVVQGEYKYP